MVPLVVIALILHPAQQDSVRVIASLTNDRIVAGESTILEIRVETNGPSPESIRLPSFPAGIEILGSQDFSQVSIRFPGGRTQVTGRTVELTGRVPGMFTIPAIGITVAGTTYRTQPVTLIVHTAPTGRAAPDVTDRVRLNARIEPSHAYIGQQVTLSAEAVFPRDLRTRQTRPATYQAPNPPGFWAQDLPDQTIIGIRSVGGDVYETQTFRRAYFPIQAGVHVFPPARLGYEYRPGPGLPAESRDLASDSLVLNVMPLPEQGQPASFTGAVGTYSMRASIEPRRANIGEAISLLIEVRGRGNIKALPAPALSEVSGFEVFPPGESASPDNNVDILGGTKRFTWVLVPQEPGRLVIPAIPYAYFDPARARYFEIATDKLAVEVAGSVQAVEHITLQPIRVLPGSDPLWWVLTPWFAAAQTAPLGILLAAMFVARRNRARPARQRLSETRVAITQLRGTASHVDRAFYGQLSERIRYHIAEIAAMPALKVANPEALRRGLESAGIPGPTAAALADLVEGLDRVRFAPDEPSPNATATVERAERLCDAIAAAHERKGAGNKSATGVAVLALILAGPLHGQSEAEFDRGVQSFLREDYAGAATAFQRHLALNPLDANGWYDAGNAHYMAGQPGNAVRAWMRAVRLQPRHRDARANLQEVAPASMNLMPPAVALSAGEAGVLLAMAWWSFAVWASWRLIGRRRIGVAPLALAILAALVLLAGAAGTNGSPAAVSVAEPTVIRADPALKAEEVQRVETGLPVSVVGRRPGWLRVRTPAGVEGWVEESQLAEV